MSFESEQATNHRSLAINDRRLATNEQVRGVLFASSTRGRNLSVIPSMGAVALAMLGMGMSWSALGVLGVGTVLYTCLVIRDAVSPKFLAQLLSLEEEPKDENGARAEACQARLVLEGVDEQMRVAYRRVLSRRTQLQERLEACPAELQASLPEGRAICATVLAHAERLVRRGQRLYAYLESTRLSDLRVGVSLVTAQGESSNDLVATKVLKQVATARKQHIKTHLEVEGLYDRVLAQLLLIETTLAGTIARIVRIMATDDEQSSMTVHLVNEELETLLSDVAILESSLDEVSLEHAAVSL